MCKPGDILTLSVKPKRMKMPLATFEGAIRVGQEKAVIVEEITLTYAFVAAVNPVAAEPAPAVPAALGTAPDHSSPPLRVAANA